MATAIRLRFIRDTLGYRPESAGPEVFQATQAIELVADNA